MRNTYNELTRKRERARVIKLRLVAAILFVDWILLTDHILHLFV